MVALTQADTERMVIKTALKVNKSTNPNQSLSLFHVKIKFQHLMALPAFG
jgi:hypothetical protein